MTPTARTNGAPPPARPSSRPRATLMGGIPAHNPSFYRRIRFSVGDPAAIIDIPGRGSTLIIRDIEAERARRNARADQVCVPADFVPEGGLSGDRETATAQSAAEFLKRAGVREVVADRTLPMLFVHVIEHAGIEVVCDPEMGVADRRSKDAQEIEFLRKAQRTTEQAVQRACEMIARASVGNGGALVHEGEPLTSERVRSEIDVWLLRQEFDNANMIVAGGRQSADCHDRGSGQLFTGQPVIIDVFPRDKKTYYFGDCTRTVVHGDIPDELARMHKTVVEAKKAAIDATRAGVTGAEVHAATKRVITGGGDGGGGGGGGYKMGLPPADAPDSFCSMAHGTGHGVGLDVHEPPLLDDLGPELVVGECLTIEPGLYCKAIGGVRVEDMVIVTETGCDNLNTIPEGLCWA